MRRAAFTLLELLISIVLVLILILGINLVFSLTSQTVSAGNALGRIHRANAAVSGTIYQDLRSVVIGNEMPALVITSERTWAYRNAVDRDSDADGRADTFDFDGDGQIGPVASGETMRPATMTHRSHRLDQLALFARGKFSRQTGSGTRLWDADPSNTSIPLTGNQAWIWYGHLKQPDNSLAPANYQYPGEGSPQANPANFYSSQWLLGRMAIILSPQSSSQGHMRSLSFATGQASDNSLFNYARFDAAPTDLVEQRRQLGGSYWDDFCAPTLTPAGAYNRLARFCGTAYAPKGFATPADYDNFARTLPVFLSGCTQFAVEYAGDFLKQDPNPASATYGNPTAAEPDGQTDFVVVNGIRSTRWYGFPRDIDGDGLIDVDSVKAAYPAGNPPWEREYARPDLTGRYVAAWGADAATVDAPRPQILRVTLTVDDAGGALGGGETFEYVGKVGG